MHESSQLPDDAGRYGTGSKGSGSGSNGSGSGSNDSGSGSKGSGSGSKGSGSGSKGSDSGSNGSGSGSKGSGSGSKGSGSGSKGSGNGSDGYDQVKMTGSKDDYWFQASDDGSATVSSQGSDGADIMIDIEAMYFEGDGHLAEVDDLVE